MRRRWTCHARGEREAVKINQAKTSIKSEGRKNNQAKTSHFFTAYSAQRRQKAQAWDETVGATATKLHGTTLHLANCSKQLYIWQLYNWQQASGIWHHLATMCCNCTCFSCTDPLCSGNSSGSQHGSSPSSQ